MSCAAASRTTSVASPRPLRPGLGSSSMPPGGRQGSTTADRRLLERGDLVWQTAIGVVLDEPPPGPLGTPTVMDFTDPWVTDGQRRHQTSRTPTSRTPTSCGRRRHADLRVRVPGGRRMVGRGDGAGGAGGRPGSIAASAGVATRRVGRASAGARHPGRTRPDPDGRAGATAAGSATTCRARCGSVPRRE